jgi:hypothetical protein
MRKIVLTVFLLTSIAPALAQTSAPPANPGAGTPAVTTPNSPPNPGAPAAGANSFTEGQAKSRIEAQGYTAVTDLKKDDQGVWRGKATRNGKVMTVSLDYQGNVVAQ